MHCIGFYKIEYQWLCHYKIVEFIGNITSQDLNHHPRNSCYEVLTIKFKKGVVDDGEKLYMKSVMIMESYFPANASTNPDVF